MKYCRFCGTAGNLIKAHVIPEAFFRPLRVDGETPLLVSSTPGFVPKRAPIGIYDKELLCAFCEDKFSNTDFFGVKILLSQFDRYFVPMKQGTDIVGYETEAVDKLRLLEFLVSIIWRASASNHKFYKKVCLGLHEQTAKDSLFQSPISILPMFDAVLSKWSDADNDEILTTALLDPYREKWDGINAYRLYLGKVVAYVKVDQRPFNKPFSSLSLRGPGPCRLIQRKLSSSNDIKAMRKASITSAANLLALRRNI